MDTERDWYVLYANARFNISNQLRRLINWKIPISDIFPTLMTWSDQPTLAKFGNTTKNLIYTFERDCFMCLRIEIIFNTFEFRKGWMIAKWEQIKPMCIEPKRDCICRGTAYSLTDVCVSVCMMLSRSLNQNRGNLSRQKIIQLMWPC